MVIDYWQWLRDHLGCLPGNSLDDPRRHAPDSGVVGFPCALRRRFGRATLRCQFLNQPLDRLIVRPRRTLAQD